MQNALKTKNASAFEINAAGEVLDNNILTIGFARRFATYKRATLILHDIERLKKIILNEEMPVQIIFSGKAHPQDQKGKELIQQVYKLAKSEELRRRIVFLEDYDMFIAERLVHGVDIWLNTPQRPREASGTSGMKAALNGAINFSVLDGWWAEAYNGKNGWAIGKGELYDNPEYQDHIEAQYLYNTLENEIIPLYYRNETGNIPEEWVNKMRESIKTVLSYFSSHRMVKEYRDFTYIPAFNNYKELSSDNFQQGKINTKKHTDLRKSWGKIQISRPVPDRNLNELRVEEKFTVTTDVFLDDIEPDMVDIEAYYGPVSSLNNIEEPNKMKMTLVQDKGRGYYQYSTEINCRTAGRYGYTVRAVPRDEDWKNTMPGLITWADV